MKLFKNIPDYVRLDDDVSFQLLRTNPRLASNAKLMYDGKNLYLESYSANPLMSTNTYKHNKVYKSGLYNNDIKNFLSGTASGTYEVGKTMSDVVVGENYDNQFENMYWCGAESINSEEYPQEMGFIAPLYLRKKRPDYFVIFKIDDPANTNLVGESGSRDERYVFKEDILDKAHIIKTFPLGEGTAIGDYIKRYIEQKEFVYDKSVYVNFGSKEIYYYGIDKSTGVLTQKVENIEDQLLSNDNTILRGDDWITNGFARNNLIFPYILNLEFLFDDNETEEFRFGRYMGFYCNDIDLYDFDVKDIATDRKGSTITSTMTVPEEDLKIVNTANNQSSFFYIKDKNDEMFTITDDFKIRGDVDADAFKGYEYSSLSTYCKRLSGKGYATMVLKLNSKLTTNDNIYISNNINGGGTTEVFSATSKIDAGGFRENNFSSMGTIYDMASAIANSISNRYEESGDKWMNVYSYNEYVIVRSYIYGEGWNNKLKVMFSDQIVKNNKITVLAKDSDFYSDELGFIDAFDGGTDVEGCLFKIKSSDRGLFFDTSGEDRDYYRYVRCSNGRTNAKILTAIPYVNDDNEVEEDYSVLVTDSNGQYVNISETEQMEIVDVFYAKMGVLSFFPVRDFDFDTVSSVYGNDTMMKNEIAEKNDIISDVTGKDIELVVDVYVPDETSNEDILAMYISYDKSTSYTSKSTYLPYSRFYSYNGDELETEYEYFCENIVPELSTVNKTAPFIAKWGYMDDGKDSCENPYRLNGSKIFNTCNFSANTFMREPDIQEYTHSMPYYVIDKTDFSSSQINNEYHYVHNSSSISSASPDVIDEWKAYFSNQDVDNFSSMFTNNVVWKNKRFDKKYSRFLLGSDVSNASTLFRGVKFEVIELVNGKETPTSKYNGYKFSFVYIPVSDKSSFKGKTYDTVYFVKNDTFKFIVGMVFVWTMNMTEFNKASVYGGGIGYNVYDSNDDMSVAEKSEIIKNISAYNIKMNINGDDSSSSYNVDYGDEEGTYKMRVCDPDSANTYDIFTSVPVMMEYNNRSIIGTVDIGLKSDANDLMIKIINRYSGYYNPIFKDIMFFNDYVNGSYQCQYSNTSFLNAYEDNYGKFGVINNLWFHRVNEEKGMKIINTLTPYYPITGQYALDYRDYNIFSSSWDMDYYTKQLDAVNKETLDNICSMKNGLCMFGSKYLNVPEEIELECLEGGVDWNEDWITDSGSCSGEMMYEEINNRSVNFYFFLHKRIVRYFKDMLRPEFEKYINPEFSYGANDTIDDDIEEYVEKNVLKLYRLDKIKMLVKSQKMGVHNTRIENDYTGNIDKSVKELKSEGFSERKNITVSKINTDAFDRKLVYNLINGEKETFGFSFTIKKI